MKVSLFEKIKLEHRTYFTQKEYQKTRQSGLHQQRRLQLPKMFETQSERCPVKLCQKYLLKRPVGMEKSGPSYLQPMVNPLTNIWYKKMPMGINSINSMTKDLISNSPLQKGEKHLVNHSAKKTLAKKLKQKQFEKSEIISITAHNREAGLDAYDSGGEVEQKQLSHLLTTISRPHPKANIPSLQINQ